MEPDLARYRLLLARYRLAAAGVLLAAWGRLDSYDEADADEFEAATSPLMEGVKVATVGAAAAFVAGRLRRRPPPVPARLVPVQPDLRRPFTVVWHALAEEHPFEQAVEQATAEVNAVAEDLVTSTARRTGDAVVERLDVDLAGWRRVAEPGACKWCQDRHGGGLYLAAADADYGHDRCRCDVVPVPR